MPASTSSPGHLLGARCHWRGLLLRRRPVILENQTSNLSREEPTYPSPHSVPANWAISPRPLIQSMLCLNACSRDWLQKQHVKIARMWPSGWLNPTLEGSACLHRFHLLGVILGPQRGSKGSHEHAQCPSPGLDVVVHLPGTQTHIYAASHMSRQPPVYHSGRSVPVAFLLLLPRARGLPSVCVHPGSCGSHRTVCKLHEAGPRPPTAPLCPCLRQRLARLMAIW